MKTQFFRLKFTVIKFFTFSNLNLFSIVSGIIIIEISKKLIKITFDYHFSGIGRFFLSEY